MSKYEIISEFVKVGFSVDSAKKWLAAEISVQTAQKWGDWYKEEKVPLINDGVIAIGKKLLGGISDKYDFHKLEEKLMEEMYGLCSKTSITPANLWKWLELGITEKEQWIRCLKEEAAECCYRMREAVENENDYRDWAAEREAEFQRSQKERQERAIAAREKNYNSPEALAKRMKRMRKKAHNGLKSAR